MQRFANQAAIAVLVLSHGVAIPAFADEPSAAQIAFLNTAAQAGRMEVEAAWKVVTTSKNATVKELAYRLIHDFGRINSDLARIAEKRGVSIPEVLDAEHAGRLQSLREAAVAAIDGKYLETVVADLAKVTELLQLNLLDSDTEIAVFSSYNLPRVRAHRQLAEDLKAGINAGRSEARKGSS